MQVQIINSDAITQNGILPTQNSLQLNELKVKYFWKDVNLILNLIAHKEVVCGTYRCKESFGSWFHPQSWPIGRPKKNSCSRDIASGNCLLNIDWIKIEINLMEINS